MEPPAGPGPGWLDFQEFRMWSINYTLSKIYSVIAPELESHGKRLFLYVAGTVNGDWWMGDYPDVLFSVAKRYNVTLIFDDNNDIAGSLVMASLAKQYGVPLMEEWAPPSQQGVPYWGIFGYSMAQLAEAAPVYVGFDYFVYPSLWLTPPFQPVLTTYAAAMYTYPRYSVSWPRTDVAFLYAFWPEAKDPYGFVNQEEYQLANMLPFTDRWVNIVTDMEVEANASALNGYRYLLVPAWAMSEEEPQVLSAIQAWEQRGGQVILVNTLNLSSALDLIEAPYVNFTAWGLGRLNFTARLNRVLGYFMANDSLDTIYGVVYLAPVTPGGQAVEPLNVTALTVSLNLTQLGLPDGVYDASVICVGESGTLRSVTYLNLEALGGVLNITLPVSGPAIYFIQVGRSLSYIVKAPVTTTVTATTIISTTATKTLTLMTTTTSTTTLTTTVTPRTSATYYAEIGEAAAIVVLMTLLAFVALRRRQHRK